MSLTPHSTTPSNQSLGIDSALLNGTLPPVPGRAASLTRDTIEEWMSRRNEQGFVPLSRNEQERCREFLTTSGKFQEFPIDSELLGPITALPPKFAQKEGALTTQTLTEQRRYEEAFGRATLTLAERLLSSCRARETSSPLDTVLVPVWRAGLVFAAASEETPILHIGAARDPRTFRSHFYHVSPIPPEAMENTRFLIADPMVGTGNTVIEVINHLTEVSNGRIQPSQIELVSMFSTPEANARLLAHFPTLQRISTAFSDTYLNEKAWILPHNDQLFLGDFGDLLRACVVTPQLVVDLNERKKLDQESMDALIRRLAKDSSTTMAVTTIDLPSFASPCIFRSQMVKRP